MDDEQGNVIDGRARARHWRGSPAKTAPQGADDTVARSEAPKSIAGSLLVPAEMLPVSEPAAPAPAAEPERAGEDAASALRERPGAQDIDQNPFLLAGACAETGRRRHRRLGAWERPRPGGRVLLACLAALLVGVAGAFAASSGSGGSANHPRGATAGSGPALAEATLNAFTRIRPALFAGSQPGGHAAAITKPRAPKRAALKPGARRHSVGRPRGRSRNRPTPTRASSAHGSAAVAVSATTSSQTPSPGAIAPVSSAATGDQSSGGPSSSSTPASGAVSRSTGSSSNGGSQRQPPFGEFGALAPGRSPQG